MRIVLAGQPNSGKSTIFNSIAGMKVKTGNFPGTTVEYHISEIKFRGQKIEIIDLPGTYSLYASDIAEKVAMDFLLTKNYDIIVNVVDSSVLSRSLELTLELAELGKPMILCLNMIDEAEKKGLIIDEKALENILGIPVVKTIGTRGIGLDKLLESLGSARIPKKITYQKIVEDAINEMEKRCGDRLKSILYLEGILECSELSDIKERLEKDFGEKSYRIISLQRHAIAMDIFEQSVKIVKPIIDFREKIDRLLFHPVLGYIILFTVFALLIFTSFYIGDIISGLIVEPLENILTFGDSVYERVLNGLWMGVVGSIGIVIPYLLPLLLILSILEDIGYLARIAYLLDAIFHKIGLHGKAAGPFILGYGCTVPAIMANRILNDNKGKIMIALLTPLIPCSARSVVIIALIGGIFGAHVALLLYFMNVIVIFIVGFFISRILKKESEGLVMEIPSLKVPSPKIIFKKIYFVIIEFFIYAFPTILISSAIFELIEYANIHTTLNTLLSPYTTGVLGLPPALGLTLIFGILRKELALYMAMDALGIHDPNNISTILTHSQIFTFTIFVMFYVPCISSIAVLKREFGIKITLLSILLSFLLATAAGILCRIIFIFL